MDFVDLFGVMVNVMIGLNLLESEIQLVGGTFVSGVEQVLSCKKNDRTWGWERNWGMLGFGGILVLLKKCEFQPLKKKNIFKLENKFTFAMSLK